MKNLILTFAISIIGFTVYSQNSISLLHEKNGITIENTIEKYNATVQIAIGITNSGLNCNLKVINTDNKQVKNLSITKTLNKSKDFFRKFFGRNPIHVTAVENSRSIYSKFSCESNHTFNNKFS